MDRGTPGWSNGPPNIASGRPDLGKRHGPHRTLCSEPPIRMSVHTMDDMGESRRKVSAHPSPQVHLLVYSMKATGWQKHSVRGFISGTLGKKMGLTVDSLRREDDERVYSIS